jgi:hypothetical protein
MQHYRSKSVLEMFQTPFQMGRPELTLAGELVILFSVVVPTLKMLARGWRHESKASDDPGRR